MMWRKKNGQCITVRSEVFKGTKKNFSWMLFNFEAIIIMNSSIVYFYFKAHVIFKYTVNGHNIYIILYICMYVYRIHCRVTV